MTTPSPRTPAHERRVRIAKVGRAHGVRGELRVFTDDPASETLAHLRQLLLEQPEGTFRTYRIVRARAAQRFWIVTLEGVQGRDAAEALCGARVWVERGWLPPTDDADEIYACDLVGLAVVDTAGRALGKVVDVFDNGAHDVLVYRTRGRQELMVPFLDAYVPTIDLDAGTVTVEPLEFLEDEPADFGAEGKDDERA